MPHPIYQLAAAEYAKALEEFKRVSPEAYAAFVRSKQTMDAYQDAPVLAQGNLSSYQGLVPGALQESEASQTTISTAVGPKKVIRLRMSEAYAVRTRAERWLRTQDGRRTSGAITKALLDGGLEIGGNDFQAKAQRVSSHLSVSPDFSNDRERGGYQIAGWKDDALV